MNSKVVLLLIAAAAAMLVYATPVITLFVGSHSTFNFDNNAESGVINVTVGSGSDEYCKQCHLRVWNELYSNPKAPHSDLSCETCHRYNGTGVKFAVINSTGAHPGRQAHAAYVPNCLECHWKTTPIRNIHGGISYAPAAAGFNLAYIPDNSRIPNYTIDVSRISYYAAHKRLIEYANDTLGDMNIGCLLCHTNYSKEISYTYHWNIDYSTLYWNFTSFSPNGTRTYTITAAKSTEFSGKHEFLPMDSINCSKCHENIYEGLINGTHAPIYRYVNPTKPGWSWYLTNLWGDIRFHARGVYDGYTSTYSLNTSLINNTYCKDCHYNPSVPDTAANKGLVHCAEKVSCLTCHGYGKTFDAYNAILNASAYSGPVGKTDPDDHENLLNQTATYARMYHGDVCMGCHEAAVHATKSKGGGGASGGCSRCHEWGNVDVYIESEPSGYAINQ
ncbi:multiheme c-type cytochrome [Archaeoglobus veneficus]|uniref:Cytochrome c-552/4 domain-containing protein n=1 Tax=Archaeoglobus veneficus (strain DSM 11195 / SNP6) TaxID=693661 RepID=F2KRJ0_ARCVS|nr:hypothetical protein [Archaeoglobus veneficus]AEA46755.1 hypothetical protein Arcve_0737 [Archaeoglobus veneficus SNP6]